MRHNFFLAHAVLKFFSPEKEKIVPHFLNFKKLFEEIAKVLSRIIYIGTPKDTAIQFPPETALLEIRNNIPLIFLVPMVLLFLLGVIFLIKKRNSGAKFLSIFLLVIFVGISAYNYFFPGYTYEWFFTIALPAFAICFAASLAKIKKEIAIFLLCLFSVLNCSFIIFGENSYSYAKKIELLKWAKNEIKDQKYSLISLGGTYFYSGYRYLADQVELPPVKSYMDLYYEWLYPRSSSSLHPSKILVIVNYSEFENKTFWQKYSMFKEHTIISKTIYPIEGLIVDNSNGWLNTIKYDYFK